MKFFSELVSKPVVLLTGAGSTSCLGLCLMESFVDLLEEKLPDAERSLLRAINLDEGRKDLERVFERLESYSKIRHLAKVDRSFGGAVNQHSTYGAFASATISLDDTAKDLLFTHYGSVGKGKASEVFGPLLDIVARSNGGLIPIFTTNYDPAIETIVHENHLAYRLIDGFRQGTLYSDWDAGIFGESLDLAQRPKSILLAKLHGSIDWRRDAQEVIKKIPHPFRRIPGLEPVLLYPLETKQLVQEPFITLYELLKECLRSARVCVAIGYSFRDPILQAAIVEVAGESSVEFVIVSPSMGDTQKQQDLSERLGVPVKGIGMKWGDAGTQSKLLEQIESLISEALASAGARSPTKESGRASPAGDE